MTDAEAIQRIAELTDTLAAHESHVRSFHDAVTAMHEEVGRLTEENRIISQHVSRRFDEACTQVAEVTRLHEQVRATLESISARLADLDATASRFPEAIARMEVLTLRSESAADSTARNEVYVREALEALGGVEGAQHLKQLRGEVEATHREIRELVAGSLHDLNESFQKARDSVDQRVAFALQEAFGSIKEYTATQATALDERLQALLERVGAVRADLDVWMQEEDRMLSASFRKGMTDLAGRIAQSEKLLTARTDAHVTQSVGQEMTRAMNTLKTAFERNRTDLATRLAASESERKKLQERIDRLEAATSITFHRLRFLPYWQAAVLILFVIAAFLALWK